MVEHAPPILFFLNPIPPEALNYEASNLGPEPKALNPIPRTQTQFEPSFRGKAGLPPQLELDPAESREPGCGGPIRAVS